MKPFLWSTSPSFQYGMKKKAHNNNKEENTHFIESYGRIRWKTRLHNKALRIQKDLEAGFPDRNTDSKYSNLWRRNQGTFHPGFTLLCVNGKNEFGAKSHRIRDFALLQTKCQFYASPHLYFADELCVWDELWVL